VPAGREKKVLMSRVGREQGRKCLQRSKKRLCHCRTTSLTDSTADLCHSRLDSRRLESWSELFRMQFYFNVGTQLRH